MLDLRTCALRIGAVLPLGLDPSTLVSGITSDSRQVQPGSIFVAIRGAQSDGHAHIASAIGAGAVWVIGSGAPDNGKYEKIFTQVPDPRHALGLLSSAVQGDPSRELLMIGVTGTSGKTTSTYILESMLRAAGHEVGLIGTVNFRHGSKIYPSTHTTPGAPELNRLLRGMRSDGCTAVVMEVSSHALKQHRTAGLVFDAMVFTNLSQEHLDFHPDMDDYFSSKALLFTEYVDESIAAGKRPVLAVNLDDEYGARLAAMLGRSLPTGATLSPFRCSDWKLQVGLSGIHGERGQENFDSRLFGGFNASNIIGAWAAARGLGIAPDALARGVENCSAVPGRLERVVNDKGIHVLVDYAHKPDALEKVLVTLKGVKGSGRLITVFGCGGDRDRSKRPIMGQIAVSLSDLTVITSDNPRTEDPEQIISEILAGIASDGRLSSATLGAHHIEPDRKRAIAYALGEARPGDLVLIAGKGHEDYQILGTTKVPFDDRLIAAECLSG